MAPARSAGLPRYREYHHRLKPIDETDCRQFVAPFPLRLLGHAKLCGALYVTYQSNNELQGEYMLCALFNSYLLLASRKEKDKQLKIVAIIGLGDAQVDKPDNGRGKTRIVCMLKPYTINSL